jgi:hypothetical protein
MAPKKAKLPADIKWNIDKGGKHSLNGEELLVHTHAHTRTRTHTHATRTRTRTHTHTTQNEWQLMTVEEYLKQEGGIGDTSALEQEVKRKYIYLYDASASESLRTGRMVGLMVIRM